MFVGAFLSFLVCFPVFWSFGLKPNGLVVVAGVTVVTCEWPGFFVPPVEA